MNIMGIVVTTDVTDIMDVNVFVASMHAMQLPKRRINCYVVIVSVSYHPEPKFFMSPRIYSKEPIPPGSVA